MNRQELLSKALEIITVDRAATHGEAEESFSAIAELWSCWLDRPITSTDVAVLMCLFKVARLKSNPAHTDNWIDLVGYAAIGGEINTEYKAPSVLPLPTPPTPHRSPTSVPGKIVYSEGDRIYDPAN